MSKRVLIIDDEKDTITYLASILKKEGYDVIFAEDGVEGLEKARNEKPDMIVLDILMPRKNGIKVLEALRRNDESGNIAVIMLSKIRDFIEQAYIELDNVEIIKRMETLLDHPDSMSEVYFLRFHNFRKCILLDRYALVKKYIKEQPSATQPTHSTLALPDVFLDKPIDPDAFIQVVARFIGKP